MKFWYGNIVTYMMGVEEYGGFTQKERAHKQRSNVSDFVSALFRLADAHATLLNKIAAGESHLKKVVISKTHLNLFVKLMDPAWQA